MKSPCPIALLGLLVAGCTGTQPPPAAPGRQPIGLQLQQQDDSLSGQRFRTLLDFEQNDDVVFVTAPADIAVGGHTGASCVRVAAPSSTIKIGSLLYGSKLPGGWTLIGAYVRPDST